MMNHIAGLDKNAVRTEQSKKNQIVNTHFKVAACAFFDVVYSKTFTDLNQSKPIVLVHIKDSLLHRHTHKMQVIIRLENVTVTKKYRPGFYVSIFSASNIMPRPGPDSITR